MIKLSTVKPRRADILIWLLDPLVAVLGHISLSGHHLTGLAGWRGRQTLLLMCLTLSYLWWEYSSDDRATNRFGQPPWGPTLSLQLIEQLRERTGKLAAELANGVTVKTVDIIEAVW